MNLVVDDDPTLRTFITLCLRQMGRASIESQSASEAIEALTCSGPFELLINSDLLTSMESQLLNRYHKDNACGTGIYLVGWFSCEQWDSSDYRKTVTPKKSAEEISQILGSQAKVLPKDGNQLHSYVLNAALRQ